jgi:hypothetical protein
VCQGTGPSLVCHANYEAISGLADGVLDAGDPRNSIIQDIQLGKSTYGKVHCTATFQLVKPIDMSKPPGDLRVRVAFHGPLSDDQRAMLARAVARWPFHKLMTTTDVQIEIVS